ncbi:MAG: DUF84 family protein [Fidelibacterota bacterium]
MIVAVGSLREPKISAVNSFIKKIKDHLKAAEDFNLLPLKVPSNVPETPRSFKDLMTGAKNRVINMIELCRDKGISPDYYIGMEGGCYEVTLNGESHIFLQSWVYVSNGEKGFFGSSVNIELPSKLSDMVMREKVGLGAGIDILTGKKDVRDREGTFGILTRNKITRQKSFEMALTAAFAPFYNTEVYMERE